MADIELSDNPNVDTGYVTVGDKKHKTQLTAQLDASNIELSDSPNVDTGFVRINGKKHKVKLVASLYGGGGGGGGTGAVDSVNGKTGTVILAASDIPMGEDTVESAINDKISQTGGALTGALSTTIAATGSYDDMVVAEFTSKRGSPVITFQLTASSNGIFKIRQVSKGVVKDIISLTPSLIEGNGTQILGSMGRAFTNVYTNAINDLTAPGVGDRLISAGSTLPRLTARLLGTIVQYTGPTTSDYISGHFYKAVDKNGFKWEELSVNNTNFINSNAALYTLTSLESFFTSSDAKLAKVYNESKLPTSGSYTVFSLGWTYTDSGNAPALLAVELATGKLYYYQGTEANCTSTAWKEFNFGGATLQSTDDYGIRGDYCSKYGVIKIGNSKPDIISSTEILWVGPNIIKMPGTLANPSESLVTLANSITHTIHKTTDFDLVYVHGLDELLECDKVCFSRTKPTEEGTCQVWFNGIEWKFRDVNQGNVWTAARCQPLGRVIFTDGAPTRIDYVGWYHPNMYNA